MQLAEDVSLKSKFGQQCGIVMNKEKLFLYSDS